MRRHFCIGDFPFEIQSEADFIIPEMFKKFESSKAATAYVYHIMETDVLPELTADVKVKRADLIVSHTDGLECRMIGRRGTSEFYALYEEQSDQSSSILLKQQFISELNYDTLFSSLFALERHLMQYDQFILHCAYVRYQGEAILFSAPSETGKTTQANLWEQYRQSRTINGDRALLSFSEGRLMANGWPVCGSSEVCENESTPVRAIVMLGQGKENRIRRIGGREAFSLLYSQLTVNTWNQEFVNRSIDFIEKMLAVLPVYHFSCTISEEAVEVLEQALLEGQEAVTK